jgi:subtilisin family serine protease
VARVPQRHVVGRADATHALLPPLRDWNRRQVRVAGALAQVHDRDVRAIRVGIVDTGVDHEHPLLAGRVHRYVHRYEGGRDQAPDDIVGHGTHVAGIVAAQPHDALHFGGMCLPELHVWKVFTEVADAAPAQHAFFYLADPVRYRQALAGAARARLDVLNLSLGGLEPLDFHEQVALDAMLAGGTTVVSAMGNYRRRGSPTVYPAATPGVIAVGATDPTDTVGWFSSRGQHIALVAPGVSICSTLPRQPGQLGFTGAAGRGRTMTRGAPMSRNVWSDSWWGTSMATPHVSMSAGDVRERLMHTAVRVPAMGRRRFTPDYGAGRLDVLGALTA